MKEKNMSKTNQQGSSSSFKARFLYDIYIQLICITMRGLTMKSLMMPISSDPRIVNSDK